MHPTLIAVASTLFQRLASAPAPGDTPPPPATRFNGLRLFAGNGEAWQAKRALIAEATATLDLAYFIVEPGDATTAQLLQDLRAAARRGVRVRLLADYLMTVRQTDALRALAAEPGLQVRQYGAPPPDWLQALAEAGIDADAFITGLSAGNASQVVAALQGSPLFPRRWIDALRAPAQAPSASPLAQAAQVFGHLAGLAREPLGWFADGLPAAGPLHQLPAIVAGLHTFLHRTHHKLLLADGRRFIMGGRNLADAYQRPDPPQGHPFWDLDIHAQDSRPASLEHLAAFEALWAAGHDVAGAAAPPATVAVVAAEPAAPAPALPAPGGPVRTLADLDGCIVNGLSGPGEAAITDTYVRHVRALAASGAGGTIDIVSAYLFLDDDGRSSPALRALRACLLEAAAAGITVNLRTNALATTDLRPVNAAFYRQAAALIAGGIRVFELKPGHGSLHAKAAAIGDDVLLIGSYNMDPRSELYDSNNLIVLRDPTGAATATFRSLFVEPDCWAPLTAEAAAQLQQETAQSARRTLLFEPLL
ncbi:phospholipase D-like domain-containing protein [Pseudorhodoferax sp.]|uniref:phospholipase D-like domain-containing protein n=1 Tax=Pseudorhodoferax sp. TaxID=1993553 RepID=UPI0039E6D915